MAEGMSFSFPSLLFHEGRTYGQPEVVPISLPQVATGLRSRLPGSFRRRGFQPDCLMPQRHSSPERRIPAGCYAQGTLTQRAFRQCLFLKLKAMLPGIYAGYVRKEESRHGDFSLHNQNSRTK